MTIFDEQQISLSAEIVAAYVSNNPVPVADLSELIAAVHRSVAGLQSAPAAMQAEPAKPAIAIKQSIQQDYIVCLEDGLRFKSMKRHLGNKYGMTPAEYRAKWKLPADYPMVAPAYAARRSVIAKSSGLGQNRRTADLAKKGRKKVAGK